MDDSSPSGKGGAFAHSPANEGKTLKRQKEKERKSKALNELAWLRAVAPPSAAKLASAMGNGKGGKDSGSGKGKNVEDTDCSNWKARKGSCSGDGPCAFGRKHRCNQCGGDHRALNCSRGPPPPRQG